MNWIVNNLVYPVLIAFMVGFMLFVAIMFPFNLYAESVCLGKGFPKAHVTYNGNIYCSNLSGSVTILVEKQ